MGMWGNQMGVESVKDVADMMKVNNTVSKFGIRPCHISSATDICHLSEGLVQNTGLRELYMGGQNRLKDDHVSTLCPELALNKGLETLNLWSSFFLLLRRKGWVIWNRFYKIMYI
jgi:hypothetical protein